MVECRRPHGNPGYSLRFSWGGAGFFASGRSKRPSDAFVRNDGVVLCMVCPGASPQTPAPPAQQRHKPTKSPTMARHDTFVLRAGKHTRRPRMGAGGAGRQSRKSDQKGDRRATAQRPRHDHNTALPAATAR